MKIKEEGRRGGGEALKFLRTHNTIFFPYNVNKLF